MARIVGHLPVAELESRYRAARDATEARANRHFATRDALDAAVARRCRRLDTNTIRPHTDFHWWPRPIKSC